ncbi:hypothetical protein EDB83DRAFT_2520861 [Lactarius deliciosus]|nr:hypothetical protein EDB83DRAFT_2520861 [Lactarius deliciosus]
MPNEGYTNFDPILSLDLHRYPDPSHPKIKNHISECVDCHLHNASPLVMVQTRSGEKILANISNISADGSEGGDKGRFSLRVDEKRRAGNPTRTLISLGPTRAILDYEPFKGIAVVDAAKDETYIDFPEPGSSVATLIVEYANLMQTLSKSFGLAEIWCIPLYALPVHFSSIPHADLV